MGDTPRVAVVGLGVMGSAIAERLVAELGSIAVYDIRPDAVTAMVERGATPFEDLPALARVCDVVVLSLNTAQVVDAVVNGSHGLAAASRPLLVIDMSSIDPAATRRIATRAAEAGLSWVDAPLSGGAPRASRGRLTLMLGGDPDDVRRARPVLDRLAERITHLGPVGSGQLVKLINQLLVGTAFSALAEAAALVRAAGLPPDLVLSALAGGRADSAVLQEFFVKFATADLTPTGRIANMVKDLDGALDHARGAGLPLPVTSLVCELNRWLVARGLGDADNAALMSYYDPTVLEPARDLSLDAGAAR